MSKSVKFRERELCLETMFQSYKQDKEFDINLVKKIFLSLSKTSGLL